MKRITIVSFVIILLVSVSFFFIRATTMMPDCSALESVSKSCSNFKYNKLFTRALMTALEEKDKPACYYIMKLFYHRNRLNDESFNLHYRLSLNLINSAGYNTEEIPILLTMLMIRESGKYFEDDDQLICLFLSSLRNIDLVGADAISMYYFGKRHYNLSATESIRLAVLCSLPNESAYSQSDQFRQTAREVVLILFRRNVISESEYKTIIHEFR
ncbi:MAG TPA: hypothetical protein P5123_03445 [Spirochaetota bacterium]|mgnify:CR=1 FL=1|nr:hypothetical protein [Spirochaetota bacterium]